VWAFSFVDMLKMAIFIDMRNDLKLKWILPENSFDAGVGGTAGAISYAAPYGTPGGPDNSQNPSAFDSNNSNKQRGNNGSLTSALPETGSMERDLDTLYAKRPTPSPDEIIAGIKYEMGQQTKKDKGECKQIVLQNLKKDPKFYSGLKMLGITDADMVNNMNENSTLNAGIDLQVYNKLQELKTFKIGDYIGLRIMREQLNNCLIRLANAKQIYFDGTTATAKSMNESRHPNDAPERTKVKPNIEETKKIFADMSKGHDQKYVVNSQICDVMKEMRAAKQQRSS
jgi:hypothetical protein